jgi:Ser/Thr protein kinase RdoA (MazF antagonist)
MFRIETLKKIIEEQYNISINEIQPAKRGYMAETYKISSKQGDFFAKIVSLESHKAIYQDSFKVIEFLNKNGIDFILKNIKTKNNDLFCDFENSVFGLFEYVEGEHSENYPLNMLFEKYSRIYQIDTKNLDIKQEKFKASSISLYESNLDKIKNDNNKEIFKEIIQYFDLKKELIELYKQQLRQLGSQCGNDLNDFYITHGDGQGNVIVNDGDITIIDWDTPLLSPIERDSWVFLDNQNTLKEFNEIINKNNIKYTLKKERLYYYCYFYFFYYLAEIIEIIYNLEDEITIRKLFEEAQDLFSKSNWMCKRMLIVSKDLNLMK